MRKPLSQSELEIMDLLWRVGRPLTRAEIIKLLPNKKWNEKSIHLILNNIIDKGVLEVKGFERCGKIYGRTYGPVMTRAEFIGEKINEIIPQISLEERIDCLICAFAGEKDISPEILKQLETGIRKKRKEFETKLNIEE